MLAAIGLAVIGLIACNSAQDLSGGPINVTNTLEYRLLSHQIASMVDLLREDCQWSRDQYGASNLPFYPEDSPWWWGVRREKRSIRDYPALFVEHEMRLDMGEKLLLRLKNDYIQCQLNGSGIYMYPHAFTVLKTGFASVRNIRFLVLKVRFPSGTHIESATENWCRDYQNLCASYGRRPTGCAGVRGGNYARCGAVYNSKRDYPVRDPLSCNPSGGVRSAVIPALGESPSVTTCFGFHSCSTTQCHKRLRSSASALYNVAGSYNTRIGYTVCY